MYLLLLIIIAAFPQLVLLPLAALAAVAIIAFVVIGTACLLGLLVYMLGIAISTGIKKVIRIIKSRQYSKNSHQQGH